MLNIRRISLEEARIAIEAAKKKSKEINVQMCMAIVDEGCNLVSFDRMDHAKITSISIAIDKAYTSASTRRSTEDYVKMAGPGGPSFGLAHTNNGRFSIIGGGIPITIDGETIGAIGISAGTAAQDVEVAKAGVEAIIQALKQ